MASAVQVKVKHNGKLHELTLDLSQPASAFKAAIHTATGVPVDRQKVMVKGGLLKDETDMASLGAKNGQVFMVIGTAGELPKAPIKPVTFVEDMTDSQLAIVTREKAGLTNLGNTCYLNSTLQVLRAIPELHIALGNFKASIGGADGESNLTASLRDLFKSMNQTTEAFHPFAFLTILRQVAPQFAEMSRPSPGGVGGGYAQQDAEEVWIRIINALQNALPGLPPPSSDSPAVSTSVVTTSTAARKFVQQYMTGEMAIKRSCPEAPSEEASYSNESFTMLQCNISGTTNEMLSGISDSLTQQIEKNSPTLGRTVVYNEQRRINRLPSYLACHFVRFFWRRDIGKKTKIMRKVKFPFDLDTTDFLSDELKKKVQHTAESIKQVEKARDERAKIRKRAKAKKDAADQAMAAAGGAGRSAGTDPPQPSDAMAVDIASSALPKDGAAASGKAEASSADASAAAGAKLGEVLTEQEELALREKEAADVRATIDTDLLADIGANTSGLYELIGIVTHKGAAADAGHYISWVKKSVADAEQHGDGAVSQKNEAYTKRLGDLDAVGASQNDEWYKFDDDKVSTVSREKITMLDGGGEDSVAYILLYRSKQIH
ncbi:cysteine proteinase [Tilletiaria anomala UBC 951]|uniref:Ubiquitin carboxyl-terminal hydrolase n=1 Tax=Tilletiaria anomala (strain ATCC 24038 / CBS 436.72 / UBC 951) TaxID=1037660 RepID=A0A066WB35_TILAU|nr:cysteine proteinase [Tilletiaria anomala UBC 951]KDN47985.1 cysteine proteinase [Tilletiaria anomala UBC 951]